MELEIIEGDRAGLRVMLPSVLLVGRSISNDLVLNDPSLSQVQCRFETFPDGVMVTDLGSTNGTLVNGAYVLQSRLQDGDDILIGDTLLRLHTHHPGGGDSAAPVSDLQGDIFGQIGYTLNRKIAEGGMGAVYEATQYGAEGFVKRVAIKTILQDFSERTDFIAAFVEEARLVADLVHPNIVQIYHLGRHGDGYYIAMEYVDGITLSEFTGLHVRNGIQVPVVWAVYIASAVSRALDYAFCHYGRDGEPLELVHRDVSPNNIMIDVDGGVKLADFGVARVARLEVGSDFELVGCVEFMSPEQAACKPLDGRSDQYALGLVFYELLTGTRAYHADYGDLQRALDTVIQGEVPDPLNYAPDLPDEIHSMLCKMLRKDPDERYRDCGMLADACDAYLRLCGCLLSPVDLAAYVEDLRMRENIQDEDWEDWGE